MKPWIYVYSRFTDEALFFLVLFLFAATAAYLVFYIVRKRRLGIARHKAVPEEIVREYLDHVLGETHELRKLLFGIQPGAGAAGTLAGIGDPESAIRNMLASAANGTTPTLTANISTTAHTSGAPQVDEAALEELKTLKEKLRTSQEERIQLEADLKATAESLEKSRQDPTAGGGAPGAATSGDAELKKKLKELEEQLSEYAVIEDDLADLKRLQQENAKLKAQLGGGAPPAAVAPVPVIAAAAAAVAVDPAPVVASITATQVAAAVEKTEPDEMEALSTEIEKSLEAADKPAEAASIAAASSNKSDQDLLAEFERMLGVQ